MKNRSFNRFAAVSILAMGLFGTTAAKAYSDLVVVGDSLSDVGNLFIATGGTLPQDPPYFQGRFSDGESYSEHLYRGLGLPGVLTPSFVGGTNYAVGGARTRYHTFDNPLSGFDPAVFDPLTQASSPPQSTFTLGGQVESLLVNNSFGLDSQALFSVWIGSNDVADAFASVLLAGGDTSYAQALLAQSASDVGLAINAMVGAGATHLLIPTVPNLGLVPEVQALLGVFPSADVVASTLTQAFNSLVDAQLASITADITRLDTYTILTQLVDDPTLFDLPADTNVSDACFSGFVGVPGVVCDNPGEYVFFDQIHPSALTHAVLGNLAANAVPVPVTLALIGLGLAVFGFRRHRTA